MKIKKNRLTKSLSFILALTMIVSIFSMGVIANGNFDDVTSRKEMARILVADDVFGSVTRATLVEDLTELDNPDPNEVQGIIEDIVVKVHARMALFNFTLNDTLHDQLVEFLEEYVAESDVRKALSKEAIEEIHLGSPAGLADLEDEITEFATLAEEIDKELLDDPDGYMDSVKIMASLLVFISDKTGSPTVTRKGLENKIEFIDVLAGFPGLKSAMESYLSLFYSEDSIDTILDRLETKANEGSEDDRTYLRRFLYDLNSLVDGVTVYDGSKPPVPSSGGGGGGSTGGSTGGSAPVIDDDNDTEGSEDEGTENNGTDNEDEGTEDEGTENEESENEESNEPSEEDDIIRNAVDEGEFESLPEAEIQKKAVDVATKEVEKVNKLEANATKEERVQKVEVEDKVLETIDEVIEKVLEKTAELNNSLEENEIDQKLEVELQIDVRSEDQTEETEKAEVGIPSDVFVKATEKAVDKVSISTDVAKVKINPTVVGNRTGERVSLSVEVVKQDTLPQNVRDIAGDNKVYDFNLFVGQDRISDFDEPVEVSVPFTPVPGEDPKFATVFFVDDDGTLQQMKGKYNPETGTLDFKTNHFSYYMTKYNRVSFDDLTSAEWSRELVEEMASKGVINGRGNNLFDPNANLTRAEFVTLILNVFDITIEEGTMPVFSDVSEGDWFYNQVQTAYAQGLVNGRSAETFAPNDQISRQDMTVIIKNAWEKYVGAVRSDDQLLRQFGDLRDISIYALDAVSVAAKLGLINGYEDATFRPQNNATRAEAAVVINKLFNQL